MRMRLFFVFSAALVLLALAIAQAMEPGQKTSASSDFGGGAPIGPSRVVESSNAPTGQVVLDVHVEANASGEGSAHVVASSQGGQALAHIDTKGAASGVAVANAPSLKSGGPLGQGGMLPLDAIPGITPVAASGSLGIVGEVVNLRAGPGLNYAILGAARGGETYAVTGWSADQAWWRVCCVNGLPAWVSGSYVSQTQALTPRPEAGALGAQNSEVLTGQVAPIAVPTPSASAGAEGRSPTATVTPAPTALPFTLEVQEQHNEANSAVVYGWVHDAAGASLDSYSLRITKDGQVVPGGTVATTSYRQGTTRPGAPGGADDKPYNFKMAFDPRVVGQGFDPVGAWSIQLIDAQGRSAGMAALFVLQVNDPYMEMYVSYSRNTEYGIRQGQSVRLPNS